MENSIPLTTTLKKLRKTCKVSQEKMAELLGLDQASVSRMESGGQSISAENLIKISQFYKLPLDQIVSGKVNYWSLAKKFGQKPALKRRYKDQNGGTVREFLPLIAYLNKKQGSDWTHNALSSFDLESLPLINPDEEISKNCFLDFVVHCLSEDALNNDSITMLATEYTRPELYGQFSKLIFTANDPLAMAITYSNASDLHDSLVHQKVIEMGRNQVVLGLEKKDHLGGKKFLTESGLDQFVIDLEINKFDRLLASQFKDQYSIKYHKEFGPGLKGEAELLIQVS